MYFLALKKDYGQLQVLRILPMSQSNTSISFLQYLSNTLTFGLHGTWCPCQDSRSLSCKLFSYTLCSGAHKAQFYLRIASVCHSSGIIRYRKIDILPSKILFNLIQYHGLTEDNFYRLRVVESLLPNQFLTSSRC